MSKQQIGIRLDSELIRIIDELAKKIYKDRTEIITEAIVKYLALTKEVKR